MFTKLMWDQELVKLLISGGDERLFINESGLNNYGCAPYPRDAIAFGSCTSSSPSMRVWHAAEKVKRVISDDLKKMPVEDIADNLCEDIRHSIAIELGIQDFNAELVLSPSGTDAEMLALTLVGFRQPLPILNIVVGPDEIGSGGILAAAGKHFSHFSSSGAQVVKGEPVSQELASRVEVLKVRIRRNDGLDRLPDEIDEEVNNLVNQGLDAGKQVIVHVVAHSKTGIHAPSLEFVKKLLGFHRDKVVILIDSAQGRFSRRGLKKYLESGCMVLLTGSKFFGGPPFSGALIVPRVLSPSPVEEFVLPKGFSDYFTAYELPRSWQAAREALGNRANIGLIIRWKAALEEVHTYYNLRGDDRLKVLRYFEHEAPIILKQSPYLQILDFQGPLLDNDRVRLLESKRTVFSIYVEDQEGNFLDYNDLKRLMVYINTDLNKQLAEHCTEQELEIVSHTFHIGQPVIIGKSKEGKNLAIVRVAIGGRLINDVVLSAGKGFESGAALEWLGQQLCLLRDKINIVIPYFKVLKNYG